VPKIGFTASRLNDGTVLVTGGSYDDVVGFAELYDLVAGGFVTNGSMTSPRFWHTATLLKDGRILIAGGAINGRWRNPATSSAEIYAPPSFGPAILRQPSSQTIKSGKTAVFTVAVVGVPPPTYQWLYDGVALQGETNATLVVENADSAATGPYRV